MNKKDNDVDTGCPNKLFSREDTDVDIGCPNKLFSRENTDVDTGCPYKLVRRNTTVVDTECPNKLVKIENTDIERDLSTIQLHNGVYFCVINQSTCRVLGSLFTLCILLSAQKLCTCGSSGSGEGEWLERVLVIMENNYFLSLSSLSILA